MTKPFIINQIMKVKNLLCGGIIIALSTTNAMAGGYITNTNQSINFLRNPAREASIGIDGVYYNPAGAAFLSDGFHLQFNWQHVKQQRDALANYGNLFKYNFSNPSSDGNRKFKGDVNVPIQPSLYFAYNRDKWSFQAGLGVIGGGGSCEFEDGVASFEALVGNMGMTTLGQAFGGYTLDSYVKGRSYSFGLTLTAARKISDKLSISLGIRNVYATNNYVGHLRGIKFRNALTGDIIDVPTSYSLDCDQRGFGISPIIGIDYKPNRYVNFAAKYEFKTRMRLKNSADNSESLNQLAQTQPAFRGYMDGVTTANDIPGLLTVGAQISPTDRLRLDFGYHHYFDVDTKQWTDDNVGDTDELTAGMEFDITRMVEVSCGYQKTMYNQTADNLSDMGFCLDSYSFGFGVGVRVSQNIKLNAAYFQTNYDDYTKNTAVSSTTYSRKNSVIGLGIDVSF